MIGRSIREGIRAASRSWTVMAAMVGCWAVVLIVVGGLAATTRIPAELFREPEPATSAATPVPVTKPSSAPAPAGSVASATPTKESAASASATASAPTPAGTAAPSGTRTKAEWDRERARIALEWFGRAWPVLSLCVLLLIIAGAWIQGAQLGYLTKQVAGEHPRLSDFLRAGTRAFGPLLGATLLSLAAVVGGMILLGLVGAILASLSRVVPGVVLGLLAVLLGVAVVIGLIWVGVRLAFWFIAVVADALGPLQGLKTTFRVTRGRWWGVFGFSIALSAIALGIQIAVGLFSALVGWMGALVNGPITIALFVFGRGIGLVANLFTGFAILGAYIRYYKDLGGSAVSASPASVVAGEPAS